MKLASRISRWYFRQRYAVLFYSLLTTIALEPAFGIVVEHAPLTRLLLAANLVLAVLSSMTGTMRRGMLAVALLVSVAQAPSRLLFGTDISTGRLLVWAVVAIMSTACCVIYTMRGRRVDGRHVYAALSAYLLAGIVFGSFHHLVEIAVPGSYSILGVPLQGTFAIEESIYFSFVTLATLGYGDIIPLTGAARGIATVEALTGQLYLAVMIARIVSLYATERPQRSSRGEDQSLDR
ncbi:MAG: hypothetical protein IT175_04615 [Acidobacteria bacterium]|nr:hypothetical protein [Acidobacteriota bacterium]